MHLKARVCSPFFQISLHLHICVTETWLSHCWHLCIQWGISITEDIQDFVIPCHCNWTLMDAFLSSSYCDKEFSAACILKSSLFQTSAMIKAWQLSTNFGMALCLQNIMTISGHNLINQQQLTGWLGNAH